MRKAPNMIETEIPLLNQTEKGFSPLLSEILKRMKIYVQKKKRKYMSRGNWYTNVHSSIIHNHQKVERTHMSINWWIDKQNMYSRTMEYYLAVKCNEVLIPTTTWVGGPWNHHTKWNKSDIESHILYGSTCTKCPEKTDLQFSGCLELGLENGK